MEKIYLLIIGDPVSSVLGMVDNLENFIFIEEFYNLSVRFSLKIGEVRESLMASVSLRKPFYFLEPLF